MHVMRMANAAHAARGLLLIFGLGRSSWGCRLGRRKLDISLLLVDLVHSPYQHRIQISVTRRERPKIESGLA